MITNASSFLIPLILVFLIFVFSYWAWKLHQKIPEGESGMIQAHPDMPISDAINYMVNESSIKLKQSNPPWKGVEHQDALVHVQTDLNNGKLRSWGKRQMGPGWFEDSLREIPKDYWKSACINPLFCFHKSEQAQTVALPKEDNLELYANLTLSKKEVKLSYPPKPLWRKLLKNKEFIRY